MLLVVAGCRDKACENVKCIHGTCVDGTCECEPGWGGPVCASVPCVPECVNGKCNNGNCVCDPGWEGTDCSSLTRDKFFGGYLVDENCSSSDVYPLNINADPSNVERILFSNLHRWGSIPYSVYANVNRDDFSIPLQNVGALYKVSGGGTFDKSSLNITMAFQVYDLGGSVLESCSATLDRL
jgi:hypothetical protein